MPILFTCDCGAQARIADEHAGRRSKCPKCQAIFQVPIPEPASSHAVANGSPAMPRPVHVAPDLPPRFQARRINFRLFIWVGVTFWCSLPILWLVWTVLWEGMNSVSKVLSAPSPPNAAPGALKGIAFLMALFGYAVWDAVGVICGFGLERFADALFHHDSALPKYRGP